VENDVFWCRQKLRWYTISPSDRQLADAAGILTVSGDFIDDAYLDSWASEIGVTDLLRNLRAGKTPPKST